MKFTVLGVLIAVMLSALMGLLWHPPMLIGILVSGGLGALGYRIGQALDDYPW